MFAWRFLIFGSIALLSAVLPELVSELTNDPGEWEFEVLGASLLLALGWTVLTLRATRLGKREFWHFVFLPAAMYVPTLFFMVWFSLGPYDS